MAHGRGGKRPGAGRKRGGRNARTAEIEAYARALLEAPDYRDALQERLLAGELAPQMEILLYAYAFGKPAERLLHGNDEGKPLQVIIRRAH